jgi:cysteine synthase B
MAAAGEGIVLDQFANPDNPLGHVSSTGPEIWEQTHGEVTHFVSSMGTTGTIMGVSSFLKAKNPEVQIVGLQPIVGSQIPGIRRWPEAYRPKIFDASAVDRVVDISQSTAEETMRRMAREEGIFAGVSSGASIATAIEIAESQDNVTVVAIVCDRGDRYLSTGVYS